MSDLPYGSGGRLILVMGRSFIGQVIERKGYDIDVVDIEASLQALAQEVLSHAAPKLSTEQLSFAVQVTDTYDAIGVLPSQETDISESEMTKIVEYLKIVVGNVVNNARGWVIKYTDDENEEPDGASQELTAKQIDWLEFQRHLYTSNGFGSRAEQVSMESIIDAWALIAQWESDRITVHAHAE